jgi:hypothetical protein
LIPDTTFAIQNKWDEMGQAARPNKKAFFCQGAREPLFDISQIISELIKIAFLMFQAKR